MVDQLVKPTDVVRIWRVEHLLVLAGVGQVEQGPGLFEPDVFAGRPRIGARVESEDDSRAIALVYRRISRAIRSAEGDVLVVVARPAVAEWLRRESERRRTQR